MIKVKFLRSIQQALLYKISGTRDTNSESRKFVDLAPTNQADENGTYYEALDFAVNNSNVFNIALTGPYGSGKSSVIKSFLRKYKRPALQISLASFVSEIDAGKRSTSGKGNSNGSANPDSRKPPVSEQEIERGILQQMLYSADADKLPLSRFKRIQSPKWWALAISLLVVLGCTSIWYLFQHKSEIVSGDFFKPLDLSNWANLFVFAFGFIFVWLLLHRLYLQSFGLSLKGISLKDIEIAPKSADEESILSRHIDEIIYFFQSTPYDLVIIEDLDRFKNPEILVTLREINGLINSNAGVKRHVRFLYALRDNMFKNTDRTKFFEFIVPIVPIINYSNSIDKVLEQGQRLSLIERLDPQFLREVSRYLNDLRLIRNIFNELAVYFDNLENDEEGVLDPNKLLAVLIYKNLMPSDFDALHQQKGALANLLGLYDDLIDSAGTNLNDQISKIEAEISEAKKQLPKDVSELKKIYAMVLIEKLPTGHSHIRFDNADIPIGQLSNRDDLEKIIAENQVLYSRHSGGSWFQFKVPNIETQVDELKTFAERKEEIKRKSARHIEQSRQRVQELKLEILALRTQKFAEVIRASSQQADDCFKKLGDNKELMKFLVLEGHLDDTYYQYISLFHKGRLSPHDNKFLIQIRSFNTPDPDFQIDNPSEVIAEMREEDFGQSYVLNRHLIDHLFDNFKQYESQIKSALKFISGNFESCNQFFKSYYGRGRNVQALVKFLTSHWPDFPTIATESEQSISHVARLIAYAPEKMLAEVPPYAGGPVAACLSMNTREVLSEGVEFDPSRLDQLSIAVTDLASLTDFPKVLEHVVDSGLYEINIPNIHLIFERTDSSTELSAVETKHYTTVLGSNNETLISCVQADFIRYVRHVLLKLDGNTAEDGFAILDALRHDEVATEYLEEYWGKQSAILPSLTKIPHHLHPYALEHNRIEVSWENCLAFLLSESFNYERLTTYLQDDGNMKALCAKDIPSDKYSFAIHQFLLNNEGFSSDTYRSYVSKLPKKFKKFPSELSSEKLRILIEERSISFSARNFEFLGDQLDLKVLFVAQNIDAFIRFSDDLEVDDYFRMKLLSSKISNDQKRTILNDIDPESVAADAARASVVGPILDRTSFNPKEFSFDFLRSVIANSSSVSVQVSLLNKSQEALKDNQIRSILRALPEPYSDIASIGKSPKIKNTYANRSMLVWLKQRQIISSWKPTFTKEELRIHTFKSIRYKEAE